MSNSERITLLARIAELEKENQKLKETNPIKIQQEREAPKVGRMKTEIQTPEN